MRLRPPANDGVAVALSTATARGPVGAGTSSRDTAGWDTPWEDRSADGPVAEGNHGSGHEAVGHDEAREKEPKSRMPLIVMVQCSVDPSNPNGGV